GNGPGHIPITLPPLQPPSLITPPPVVLGEHVTNENDNSIGGVSVGSTGGTVSVTLTVLHGTLNIDTLAGVTESAQSGASLTLSGSAADVNTVLKSLTYTLNSPPDEGSDILTVSVTTTDGSTTATTTASTTITVNPVAEPGTALAPATLTLTEH